MNKIDIIMMAWKNLMRRKARTFLTVLGVLIGTTSIIVMISIGIGLADSQAKMMAQWGRLNEITVSLGGMPSGEGAPGKSVKLDDQAVATFAATPGVVKVIPTITTYSQLRWGKKLSGAQIIGLNPADMPDLGLVLGEGRQLAPGDRNALVVGGTISESFYDPKAKPDYSSSYDPDAIYQTTLGLLEKTLPTTVSNPETNAEKKFSFKVVGVLAQAERRAGWNIYAPIDEVRKMQKVSMNKEEAKRNRINPYSSIILITEDVGFTKTLVKDLNEQGYYAYSIASDLDGIESQSKMIQAVLGGIGSITLFVAAIGIINTMVMSIYERTREIGIMKVIGATFSDIRMLFLSEAALIGLIGGVFGILLSLALSSGINTVLGGSMYANMAEPGADPPALSVIPLWLVGFAVLFSISIGLLAGLYPANRAVQLSPIEAIRNTN